jgi:ABC-type uncharacterized transport system ATPase subunit
MVDKTADKMVELMDILTEIEMVDNLVISLVAVTDRMQVELMVGLLVYLTVVFLVDSLVQYLA